MWNDQTYHIAPFQNSLNSLVFLLSLMHLPLNPHPHTQYIFIVLSEWNEHNAGPGWNKSDIYVWSWDLCVYVCPLECIDFTIWTEGMICAFINVEIWRETRAFLLCTHPHSLSFSFPFSHSLCVCEMWIYENKNEYMGCPTEPICGFCYKVI